MLSWVVAGVILFIYIIYKIGKDIRFLDMKIKNIQEHNEEMESRIEELEDLLNVGNNLNL